jgi:hypothetical protein
MHWRPNGGVCKILPNKDNEAANKKRSDARRAKKLRQRQAKEEAKKAAGKK